MNGKKHYLFLIISIVVGCCFGYAFHIKYDHTQIKAYCYQGLKSCNLKLPVVNGFYKPDSSVWNLEGGVLSDFKVAGEVGFMILKDIYGYDKIYKQNNVTYSAVDQQEDFWNYVNNDSYLNDHKGQYVERASSLEPWIHRFDMKIAQDFYAKIGSRKYGIQVSLDMLNIGNLLNSKWGAYRSCGLQSYDNVRLLKTASKVGEPLTYQMNASSREVFQKNSKWDYTASTGSAWQMQLGVKFTF